MLFALASAREINLIKSGALRLPGPPIFKRRRECKERCLWRRKSPHTESPHFEPHGRGHPGHRCPADRGECIHLDVEERFIIKNQTQIQVRLHIMGSIATLPFQSLKAKLKAAQSNLKGFAFKIESGPFKQLEAPPFSTIHVGSFF